MSGELEADNRLSFLDCYLSWTVLCRVGNRLECYVCRKPTVSLLGASFLVTALLDLTVWTLLSHAYIVCTNYNFVHNEFGFSKVFFFVTMASILDLLRNKFHSFSIINIDRVSQDQVSPLHPTHQTLNFYLLFTLDNFLKDFFLNWWFYYLNISKICGIFFKYKDKLPMHLKSSPVSDAKKRKL